MLLGHERDIAWPQLRLVIEVDGHHYHAPRGARETDHERDAELVLAARRVLRFARVPRFVGSFGPVWG
jgi:very-short-patch-repair endonuclease